jgi:hypothetical protein
LLNEGFVAVRRFDVGDHVQDFLHSFRLRDVC